MESLSYATHPKMSQSQFVPAYTDLPDAVRKQHKTAVY